MTDRWILTPQYFETSEPALAEAVPDDTQVNGPFPLPDREQASMALLHRPIATFVADALESGDRPVSVAGDCCAAVPVLAGMQRADITPWLVWIDAHGDFNTPETSPSQFLGGMPLAMMTGRGPRWMCESVGLKPIAEDHVWLVDARDLDPMEREALDASGVHRAGIDTFAEARLDGPVMVHIDMDVLDAREIPAFNYPVEGGPGVREVEAACRAFADANEIAAISVCGWTGDLDTEGRAAAATRKIVAALRGAPAPD